MAIREELAKRFGRVVEEDQAPFRLYTIFAGEVPKYVLCVWKEDEFVVGKVLLYERAPSMSCVDIYYDPSGLFAISKGEGEFVEKLAKKVSRLRPA